MHDAPALGADEIDCALDRPLGTPRLEVLAASKTRAVIAIDDITRPTRTAPLVARLLERLEGVGIRRQNITVIVATGAHSAASEEDIRLKVGALSARVRVVSHDPTRDVVETGVTFAGQRVRVNREFLAADLRIGIGGVMQHPFAAFSGGGKIVLPGLSDLEAVQRSHKYALLGFGCGLHLQGNRFRNDMERAVREIGIDWTVNVVLNGRCETAALVAGDLVEAHRAAAGRAREIGATPAPLKPLDALVLNAYPKDSELLQIEAALVALRAGMMDWLRPAAPVVLLGACPGGLGSHQLFGPEGRLFRKPTPKAYLVNRVLHVVSPATGADPTRAAFCEAYPYHDSWESCVAALTPTLPSSPVIGYVPNGPLHLPLTADGADLKRLGRHRGSNRPEEGR
jgi:nickel-dependent lactate racemase